MTLTITKKVNISIPSVEVGSTHYISNIEYNYNNFVCFILIIPDKFKLFDDITTVKLYLKDDINESNILDINDNDKITILNNTLTIIIMNKRILNNKDYNIKFEILE